MPLLSERHPHAKDGEIEFFEAEHYYVHAQSGKRFPISMTGLLKPCFDTFDGPAIVNRNYSKWRSDESSKYWGLIRYLELAEEQDSDQIKCAILRLWQLNGNSAAEKGTQMHKQIEDYMNGVLPAPSSDAPAPMGVAAYIGMMEWFYPEQKLEPWRVEFPVCLTTTMPNGTVLPVVAGLIDCLMRSKRDGRIWMLDWKRVDPKKKGLLGKQSAATGMWRNNEMANGPFHDWESNSFNQYSAQQHGYRHMLIESGYFKPEELAGCFLVQMHDDLDTAHVIEVADVADEIDALMTDAVQAVREKHAAAHPESMQPRPRPARPPTKPVVKRPAATVARAPARPLARVKKEHP